jgi:hypothetical protein
VLRLGLPFLAHLRDFGKKPDCLDEQVIEIHGV